MSTTVSYNGSTIATVENQTKTLLTADHWLLDNITITDAPGASPWTLVTTQTVSASTTSTSSTSLTTIACGTSIWTSSKIIYVRIRDTAGKRAGYFYGSDTFFLNYQAANNSTSTLTYASRAIHRYTTSNTFASYNGATTTGYGVYAYSITSAGSLAIYTRYNSSYSLTIDGDYKVDVYILETPDGVSPFA